jgi:hypothetical protein
MEKRKQKPMALMVSLFVVMGFLFGTEYLEFNVNFNLLNFFTPIKIEEAQSNKTEFSSAELQLIFESLVRSFNSNFDEISAKIDFASLLISDVDLKTLGNIVADTKRFPEERSVALYILSQIGETSVLSNLMMVASLSH